MMLQTGIWWPLSITTAAVLGVGWIGWRFFYLSPVHPRADNGIGGQADARSAVSDALPAGTERPAHKLLARRGAVLWALLCIAVTAGVIAAMAPLAARRTLHPPLPAEHPRGEHIELALASEMLVPPAPLPPSAFVSDARPSLAFADRDWHKLDANFANAVLALMARMEARGYPLALLEGYRSPQRQDALFAGGQRVTHAAAFQSKHQFGLAADLAPVRDGKLVLSERDPWAWEAYQALGEESEAAGLTWGGRWSLQDYGHVEARGSRVETEGAPGRGRS